MPDYAWKAFERKVAKFFGTLRASLSGGNGKVTRSDTMHDKLFIECKYRQKHSVIKLWEETNEMALREYKIPVICLAEARRPGFWIMCHSEDLIDVAQHALEARDTLKSLNEGELPIKDGYKELEGP